MIYSVTEVRSNNIFSYHDCIHTWMTDTNCILLIFSPLGSSTNRVTVDTLSLVFKTLIVPLSLLSQSIDWSFSISTLNEIYFLF